MRSKEVEKAIVKLDIERAVLRNSISKANYDEKYREEIDLEDFKELKQAIETVLNYIKELENGEVEKTNLEIAKLEYKIVEMQKNIEELKKKKEIQIRYDVKKQVVKKDLETIITFFKDCRKANIYPTNEEVNAIDTLKFYVTDSTSNEVIRDKIREYRNKKNTIYFGSIIEKKPVQQLIDEKIIEVLSEILGEEEK